MSEATEEVARPDTLPPDHTAVVRSQRAAGDAAPLHTATFERRVLTPRGRSVRATAGVLLVGLVLGAGVGAFVAGGAPAEVEASALVQLSPAREPGLGAIAAADQATESFTSSELAWLTGPGLRQAVEQRLVRGPIGALSALRVGNSSVVEIAATGATSEMALRTVEAAIATYTERRDEQFRSSLDAAIASTEIALADLGGPEVIRADLPTADQFRFDRLVSARSDLLLLRSSDPQPVQVIEEPNEVAADGPGPGLMTTVLGAILGGLLAVGAHAAWRSRTTLVLAPADALAVTDRLLHPELRLPADWHTRTLQVLRQADRRSSRLLVGQIAHRCSLAGQVIAVVGPVAESGSRAVATLMAVGAADRTSTLLVEVNSEFPHPLVSTPPDETVPYRRAVADATDVDGLEIASFPRVTEEGRRGHVDPRWTVAVQIALAERRCVVVDVGDMPELVRTLPRSTLVVVAVGVGVDAVPDATAVAIAVQDEQTGEPYGVVTRLPWHVRWAARLARVWR